MFKAFCAAFIAFALLLSEGIAPGQAAAVEITVSAASSLTDAFTEIKEAFETLHPEIKVVTNFASSNTLLRQIEAGAPVDAFAPADQATMNQAQSNGFIQSDSRCDFASNSLVLVVPAEKAGQLARTEELAGAEYRLISIGNPESVPAGRYAKEIFERKGLWDKLQDKLIISENVRQALDYVARNEVDAGFVYATDAKQAGKKVTLVEEVSGPAGVLYPVACLKNSAHPAEARLFVDFVLSGKGRAILDRHGFGKP